MMTSRAHRLLRKREQQSQTSKFGLPIKASVSWKFMHQTSKNTVDCEVGVPPLHSKESCLKPPPDPSVDGGMAT